MDAEADKAKKKREHGQCTERIRGVRWGTSARHSMEKNNSGETEKERDTLKQSISKKTPEQGRTGDVHPGRDRTDSHSVSRQPGKMKNKKIKVRQVDALSSLSLLLCFQYAGLWRSSPEASLRFSSCHSSSLSFWAPFMKPRFSWALRDR